MLFSGQLIIAAFLSSALVLLIAMTIHEFAHNYVGYRMGDPTPRDLGKLTLNPLAHIYWIGWLMWVVVGFGILGSAPISEYRMKDRRWGYFWAVAAGPLSNLALAAFIGIFFRLGLFKAELLFSQGQLLPNINQFMTMMVSLNLLLFLFNLLPFFPFDGWHMLRKLLPPQQASTLERYQRESTLVFFGLMLLEFFTPLKVLSALYGPPFNVLARVLLGF